MTEGRSDKIAANLAQIRAAIEKACKAAGRKPSEVTLVAVTKTVPPQPVNAAIHSGVTVLGENRAQELTEKYPHYDKATVKIHFIGHLQTNKVRQIIDKVDMIQSVDSIKLLAEIDRQAKKHGKICDILIEVNIGGEKSKSGVLPEKLDELVRAAADFPSVRLRGLMAVPPFFDNPDESGPYFSAMEKLFIDIKGKNVDNRDIDILSMGMSGDYIAAIKHGATMIRIGTAIFGDRAEKV
ncbi:MAG: YggS family pyridoxal phosphate-dependent enzyme [Oscillospiraceae bacterium]|nr:YggS family pyridoxal phosphate-dependent enzyme [Oscillospiraceae bacterium]